MAYGRFDVGSVSKFLPDMRRIHPRKRLRPHNFLAVAMGVAIGLGSGSPAQQGGGLRFELMQRQNIEAVTHTGDKRRRLCFNLNWFAVAILKLC